MIRIARKAWRRLISMRTALVLLFLLALAAVPGSLLPQRPLNPTKVDAYLRTHGAWGRFLDRLGLYDVFGSAWFAAIYLLLFVSLVGCLVPRIRQHAKAMARKPLPAPKNLDRLPESGRFDSGDAPVAYASAARATLGRRWRIVQREEPGGVVTLSAEKGYSRETGNLIFHVALLSALILIAVGRLFSYQGSVIVQQGQGFCNSPTSYDAWRPGRMAADGHIGPAPFCIDSLDKFTATYTDTGEPSKFKADVTYSKVRSDGTDGPPIKHTITVNHPLRLSGDRVYLIGHGFAPQITVRMPDGSVQHDQATFIPSQPTTLLSEGAFQEQGKPDAKQDIGIEGFFAPTPQDMGNGVITSSAPQVDNPVLGIFVYQGTVNPNGQPQSVFSLNKSKLTQIGQANLRIGQTTRMPNGVTVTFDGWVPWASMQVSHDPTQGYLLFAAVAMVVGLIGSLSIRRRRLWLRITPAVAENQGSPTVVSVGGLARSDSGNFTTEFAGLLDRLRGVATVAEPGLVSARKE
ncbi:MAG TPA: cytochrome c biogenesis protein ResB [Jatrophihabitantaceae bacterium]|nr:cytochrome c biogenesis protein ResB [Jatrophihabitantaceae bacterium]